MKVKCLLIGIVGLFVAGILTTSSYARIDPETVVGMWSFDEGKDDVTADSSANKNDGTLVNGPEWTEGQFGEAIQFDGADDYVDVGNADNLSITGDFTFSLWVNISEYPTGWRNMLSKLVNDTNAEFNFRYKTSTEAQFYFGTGAAAIICSWNPSQDLPLDTWTHIAGVRKSKTYLKLYFDGIEKRNQNITTDAISTDANVTIGCQSDDKFYFSGSIDEVIIFNAALEEEDIQTLMNEGLPRAVDPSGKLVSTWAALRK
jgi:hypothetical protein